MSWSPCVLLLFFVAGCGSDFEVPGLPDGRIELDLSSSFDHPPADLTCFNTACGGCSTWAKFDGTPSKVGDPCLWKGALSCMGTELKCLDTACPTCGVKMVGSICGADGHTILTLTYSGATCVAYDFGSAINVCNDGPADKCLNRCVSSGGVQNCTAHCASEPDGGGPGCEYSAAATCTSLNGC